ncbi:hypothetical protein FNYG_13921 [Fusarium nygamai]|uniref:Uncharacterized protein n=1 Tax=Gibberella nygamai TaxID=42673 RepID=A0A2K0UU89_GIBNY|nr:hypothetical protein FNYG_13921 [Fusarium nygamai]
MTLELIPESSSLLPADAPAVAETLASDIVREAVELPVDKIVKVAEVDEISEFEVDDLVWV